MGVTVFFYETWFDKGVRYIIDQIDNQSKTSVTTNFIQYQGIIECIKNINRCQW